MILQNILQIISFYSVIETFTLFFSSKALITLHSVLLPRCAELARYRKKRKKERFIVKKMQHTSLHC